MGEYFYTLNLKKRQMLHPHKLGDGLKLLECSQAQADTLRLLLCSRRDDSCPLMGSWEGDPIAIVGDYARGHDGVDSHEDKGDWLDISLECREQFAERFGLVYGRRWDEP